MESELDEYPPLLRTLLENRGIFALEEAEVFLKPSYERDIHDPYMMKDMEKAVIRVFEAMEDKEKIIIYGDYDCDGIPASVILHDLFKKVGYENFEVYIPHRHTEGYGLHIDAINKFNDTGVKLIITVDLGITAVPEVAHAEAFSIDVIVTDHHLPPVVLPRAYAILNPKQNGDKYPCDMLCGAGVAFKFAQAFVKKYGEYFSIPIGWEKWLLDMAGLGTMSDMVPLRGENRVLAYYGLKVLRKNNRPGLRNLFKKNNIDMQYLTEEDVGFTLAPRINAASRMDEPMRAFELLSTEDEMSAMSLSNHLTSINDDRKSLVLHIMKEVKKVIFERAENNDVIVIGNPKWRAGVLGLVASKIVEEYKKPAFVWGSEGSDDIKGSCRSDGSVNIVEMMRETEEGVLIDFGGHEMAGGFSVSHEKIFFLEEHLNKSYQVSKKSQLETHTKRKYEAIFNLKDVNINTYELIEKLAPFGIDNPKPVFLFESITIAETKLFGKEKNHLEVIFKSQSTLVKAIKFFATRESFGVHIKKDSIVNLLATLELSRFAGKTELRLRIIDII